MEKKGLVKNRAPAPIQITAEQILREAQERQQDNTNKPTRRRITDADELAEYRMSKRKTFEDEIRRQRHHLGTWIKYALWEESQQEFKRARSIFERAIDVDYKNHSIWLKYAEMEMKNKFVNHARNVWDRAVTLLPRVNQFWYKYAYMEEMLGNIVNARNVFERWMQWEPEDSAWFSFIKLEMRAGELDRARQIYERFLLCHPHERSYIKFAKWEMKQQQPVLARTLYERAMAELREDEKSENLYIAFAAFEEKLHEYERAKAIFQYALDQIPKEQATNLYNAFVLFEKQHGDRKDVDNVVLAKRRAKYEQEIKDNPMNYDAWFDYIRLEEAEYETEIKRSQEADVDDSSVASTVREIYERAIANVPIIQEKQYWRRYIYLWINYALFEELYEDNTDRTREIYVNCLKLIPHKKFTFAKIWIMYAHFELRQFNLGKTRKIMGQAIGQCPTHKLFKNYITLELQLGEMERCRTLYEKYLEFSMHHCKTWVSFAQLEKNVGEIERARAIFELAVSQPALDMPEMLWKSYIDFEIELEEYDNTRNLYERLLQRTKHVKVWISFAQFEGESCNSMESSREIYERAYDYLKEANLGEDRNLLLESWLTYERKLPNNESKIQSLMKKLPKKVNKKRMTYDDDGTEMGYEEFVDYIFPDDETSNSNLKILQAAQMWKNQQAQQ